MTKDPFNCLTPEEEQALGKYITLTFEKIDDPNLDHLLKSGVLFPDRIPSHWDTLPDEWEEVMETKGIVNLEDYELEKYLEQWLRLIGYAKWVQGVKEARVNLLQNCADYVRDYIFAKAEGGREQKSAVSGSHPLFKIVNDRLTTLKSELYELNGMIYKWEKIEFAISRAITNRQGKPAR